MPVWEVTGFKTGVDQTGVNFLDPADAFETIEDGFIYRQELLSRRGFSVFADRVDDQSRIMGIFTDFVPNRTEELLICSQEFLYKYNSTTNQFDQIPMAGAAPASFGITDPSQYVSGTTYLTKDGSRRFVFTGAGMSDVFFYDGTDVKSFTTVADNPDFQQPATSIGNIQKAVKVFWFNGRLNLVVPTTNVTTYRQAVLYSAIRDSSGNGDKFNTPGAGLLSADTYEYMNGALILGDLMILNFQKSNWRLEKTSDAFNPYRVSKIPSVIGTDGAFSGVSWDYQVKSVGQTGLITTDGRQSLRFDNKIPFFSRDEINDQYIGMTYGGFDRASAQFYFSYLSSGNDLSTITQDKVLVYNYEESTFSIFNQSFSVFGETEEGQNLPLSSIDGSVKPSWSRLDTTDEQWSKLGQNNFGQKTLAGDNRGFVYQLNTQFNDHFALISNITTAENAVVTVGTSAFAADDRIYFENVEGMTEINGQTGNVLSATTTSVTVDIDTRAYTAYGANGSVSKPIAFFAKTTVFNPFRDKGMKVFVSHVEILLNTQSAPITFSIYSDGESTPFKSASLIPNDNTNKQREWITVSVDQEADFLSFSLASESTSKQAIITSMRIHAQEGATNSG